MSQDVSSNITQNGTPRETAGGSVRHEEKLPAQNLQYAIDIVKLRKVFERRTRGGYTTMKSALLSCWRRAAGKEAANAVTTTVAIKDLTMRIPRGSSVGVIGRNGSGKSTFLKLMTGIYTPTVGRVQVRGRMSALIELGAGFHPDFTGRENIDLGGAMQGLSRSDIRERFNNIVDFAELRHVIDDPVRTYSSGMFMRLGFSLAVHTNPDILLIDEVLAVGDAGFVAKCKDRIAELRQRGVTLILVSHDLAAVERWCDEVIWLDQGEVRDRGEPRRVIDHYREFLEQGEENELRNEVRANLDEALSEGALEPAPTEALHQVTLAKPERWGSREVEITKVSLQGRAHGEQLLFHPDDALSIEFEYRVNEPVTDVVFGVGFHRADGLTMYGTNTDIDRVQKFNIYGVGRVTFSVTRLGFTSGSYTLDVAVHRSDGYPYDYHRHAIHFSVRANSQPVGVVEPAHSWSVQGAEVLEPAGAEKQ